MTDKTFTTNDFKKWGAIGGRKKGETKKRGDSNYYRRISKNRKPRRTEA